MKASDLKLVYQMDELDELLELVKGKPEKDPWPQPRDRDNRDTVRQIIAELELLPYGSISAYNPSGGHSDESPPPAGVILDARPRADRFAHEYWALKLAEAGDDEHLIAKVSEGAAADLAAWRGGIRPERLAEESAADFDARILEFADWSDKEVAQKLKTTPTRVRKARLADGRDPALGKKLIRDEDLNPERRQAEAKRLREANLSYRQIALRLGCGVETVRRDVAA